MLLAQVAKSSTIDSQLPIIVTAPEKLIMRSLSRSHNFSVGANNIYDNYMSPLEYKGITIRYNYLFTRETSWFDANFEKYQNIGIELSKSNNPNRNASYYGLLLTYQLGGHYYIPNLDRLKFGFGVLGNVNLGGLYNTRNGNNPATARFYIGLLPSAVIQYKITNKLPIQLQVDFSLLGCYFQPQFGESYYEIYLGNRSGLFNFTSLHNFRSIKLDLSSKVFIFKKYFRVGILGDFTQTKIHETITHNYSWNFVLGFYL